MYQMIYLLKVCSNVFIVYFVFLRLHLDTTLTYLLLIKRHNFILGFEWAVFNCFTLSKRADCNILCGLLALCIN